MVAAPLIASPESFFFEHGQTRKDAEKSNEDV